MEVMSPGSKNLQTYLVNRMLVYVYREFMKSHSIAADELSFLFSNLTDAVVRRNLKLCAGLKVSHQILTSAYTASIIAHLRSLSFYFYFCVIMLLYHIIILTSLRKCTKCRGIKLVSLVGTRDLIFKFHLRMNLKSWWHQSMLVFPLSSFHG